MTQPSPLPPTAPRIEALRLLVVDDQVNALNLIRDMLMDMGVHSVLTAAGGKEALKYVQARGSSLDAILCDWSMPEQTGLETLRLVRQIDPDIPFLMVTGAADPSSVLAAKDSGVSGYLKKPFSREDLRKKLAAIARVKAFRA